MKLKKGIYLVSLERLKNTPSGNPRFKAAITVLHTKEPGTRFSLKQNYYNTYVYVFHGHYLGDFYEARYSIQKHEERLESLNERP